MEMVILILCLFSLRSSYACLSHLIPAAYPGYALSLAYPGAYPNGLSWILFGRCLEEFGKLFGCCMGVSLKMFVSFGKCLEVVLIVFLKVCLEGVVG